MLCSYARNLKLAHVQGRSFMCLLIWQKLYPWLFHRHCSSKFFKTLHYYNLAKGLPVCNRFDDLDLVSRLQVCQNHNKIFFFSILHLKCELSECCLLYFETACNRHPLLTQWECSATRSYVCNASGIGTRLCWDHWVFLFLFCIIVLLKFVSMGKASVCVCVCVCVCGRLEFSFVEKSAAFQTAESRG